MEEEKKEMAKEMEEEEKEISKEMEQEKEMENGKS